MKYRAILSVLMALIAVSAQAQDVRVVQVVSPRIGAEIDPIERQYFGLLLHVKNFQKAKVIAGPGRYFTVVINDGAYSNLMLTQGQFARLKEYIDGYETFLESASYDDLATLASVARPQLRPARELRLVDVTLRDGSMREGYLLHSDTTALVLTDSIDVKGALGQPAGNRFISMRDVLAVRDRSGAVQRLQSQLDVAFDGKAGQRQAVIEKIVDGSFTRGIASPELHAYLRETEIRPQIAADVVVPKLRKLASGDTRRILLSARVSLFGSEPDMGKYQLGYYQNVAHDAGSIGFETKSFGATVAYSLSPRLRAGLDVNVAPFAPKAGKTTEHVQAASSDEYVQALVKYTSDDGRVQITGIQVNPMLSLVVIRPDELGLASGRTAMTYEVNVGVGPSFARMTTSTTFVTASNASNNSYDIHRSTVHDTRFNTGVAGQANVDFYVTRTISAGVVFDLRYYPRVQAETQSTVLPDVSSYGTFEIRRERFKQSAFFFGAALATRVHL